MKKWLNDYLEESILIALLIAMSVIMGVQIVARYAFQNSLSWSEECVRYMFVWSGFLGIPYCIKFKNEIVVDVFKKILPARLCLILDLFTYAILFYLFCTMAYYGWQTVYNSYISGQTSPAMGIPIYIMQASVMTGAILAIFRMIQGLLVYMKK